MKKQGMNMIKLKYKLTQPPSVAVVHCSGQNIFV